MKMTPWCSPISWDKSIWKTENISRNTMKYCPNLLILKMRTFETLFSHHLRRMKFQLRQNTTYKLCLKKLDYRDQKRWEIISIIIKGFIILFRDQRLPLWLNRETKVRKHREKRWVRLLQSIGYRPSTLCSRQFLIKKVILRDLVKACIHAAFYPQMQNPNCFLVPILSKMLPKGIRSCIVLGHAKILISRRYSKMCTDKIINKFCLQTQISWPLWPF